MSEHLHSNSPELSVHPPEGYSVRPTEAPDIPSVLELVGGEPSALLRVSREELDDWVAAGRSLVAEDPSGAIVAHYGAMEWSDGRMELRSAVVSPEHRGRGINTHMLEELRERLAVTDPGREVFVVTRPAAKSRGIIEKSGGLEVALAELPDDFFDICPATCWKRTGLDCGCRPYRLPEAPESSEASQYRKEG